jgi:hypothetical protein
MPEELKLRFRALAGVEQEIRSDIEQYRLMNLTPMDIAVRIRAIPGLAITSAMKMRAARRCAVSYWGTHRQTFRFAHEDRELLRKNWAAGAELVSRAEALGLRVGGAEQRKLWCGVPRSSVLRFFEAYSIEPTHADLLRAMLIPFIENDDTRLERWNVGIVEAGRGNSSQESLGDVGRVRMVRRAKLKDSGSVADIKALMSKNDLLFDCKKGLSEAADDWEKLKAARLRDVGEIPLLLLYPIDRVSEPERKGRNRVALDAAGDVLGVGLVFPGSVVEGGNYVAVDLKPISVEEIAEIEAEEAAQAEAAGVH